MGRRRVSDYAPLTPLWNLRIGWRRKIQQAVAELSIIFRGKRIYCTVTMGIAVHTNEHDLPKTIDQADKAMYQGKREGRNRIVTTSSIELAEPTYA